MLKSLLLNCVLCFFQQPFRHQRRLASMLWTVFLFLTSGQRTETVGECFVKNRSTGHWTCFTKKWKKRKKTPTKRLRWTGKYFIWIFQTLNKLRHNAMTVNWRICCLPEKTWCLQILADIERLKQWCWIMIWRLEWGVWRVETRLMILLLWQWRVMQVWLTCCKVVPD